MTKKDYELIAHSLSESYKDCLDFGGDNEQVVDMFTHLTTNIALALKAENPNFKLDKFVDRVVK